MFKFRSIKAALLSIVLPLVIIGMAAISLIGYLISKSTINDEISEHMHTKLNYTLEGIEKRLSNHDQLAHTLAKAVESSLVTADSEAYISMIKNIITTNEDTMGSGIWFEPYGFDRVQKFFGPYAYKEDGKVTLTMEYSNETYNYFNYDWYKNGLNATTASAWTTPYYDETSGITMITTSTPFFNNDNKVAGVITADIDLKSIQQLITESKVGNTGWAFLLSEDGIYISDKLAEKAMKENILSEANESLAKLGEEILKNKKGNGTYSDKDGTYQVYYTEIPRTGWVIGLTIPEKEMFAPLQDLLINMLIVFAVSLAVVCLIIVLYTNRLSGRITKLKYTAEALAEGNFTVHSDMTSRDEIGVLSKSFNTMIENIRSLLQDTKKVSDELTSAAINLAATSEETSSSFTEITKTVSEIARGAEVQALDAEKGVVLAASLDEKFGMLKNNSDSIYNQVVEADQSNKSGITAMEDLVEKTQLNNESMLKIEKAVEQLNAKSNNIGEVLETISTLAGQTNLLALNASIEAARAGEAGRGFAIVAGEIRKLAAGSLTSAETIRTIVETLQDESNRTVDIMNEVIVVSNEQSQSVASMNATFEALSKSIAQITAETSLFNNFITTMLKDKDQIVYSIENISSVSEETAAGSEEVTASMEEQTSVMEEVARNAERLSELSTSLEEQINKFKMQ